MINIRESRESDMPMIYSSWVRAYAGLNRSEPKWAVYQHQIETIKKAADYCTVLIATAEGCTDDDICGWLCYHADVVQFVYVKKPFRGFGVAKALMKHAGLKQPFLSAYKPGPWLADRVKYAPQMQQMDALRRYVDGSGGIKNEGRMRRSSESDAYKREESPIHSVQNETRGSVR